MEGFRINSNLNALVANGNLRMSQAGLGKSIERLSSGLRINRGADDAAGLTISEKLRGQISGLSRGIQNAQDATSLIQTAEGALNEDHTILNRMRELAIQAQSDALTSSDRLEIQKEVDQLVEEVDRIASTTEFNTKKTLDGSMSALVSSDNADLSVYQTGVGSVSAGDYAVSVALESAGTRQIQNSAIQRDSSTGNVAGLSTTLKTLESMTDASGNSLLESPQTLILKGNGQTSEVIMTSDLTVKEFADKVESAITGSVAGGGLGIEGATFAFNSAGQFIFESGRDGSTGEVSFGGEESILQALAMQETTASEDAAYSITARSIGAATETTVSQSTTNTRASGVIGGLDLQFELTSEARRDGSVAATDAVTIGSTAVVFTFHDTNGKNNDQAAGSTSAGVTITLTANRTFTTASITTLINNTINVANDEGSSLVGTATSSNFVNPGVSASFDGYNLVLTSSIKGTSGEISITGNQAAKDVLGIVESKVTGSGGTAAVLTGSVDVSEGITINGTGVLEIRVGDGDFNTNVDGTGTIASGGNITFNRGVAITGTSLVNTFNSYFSTNAIQASASLTSDGKLELRSTETGGDSKLSIATIGGASMANLGFVDGQNNTGSGGSAAVFAGSTSSSQSTHAFTMDQVMRFTVTDKNGAVTDTITLGTAGLTSTTAESFSISKEAVTSILNGSNLGTTDVDFRIDAGNRLDFFSRSTGSDSRVQLSAFSDSDFLTVGRNSFGIDFQSSAQGRGETDFTLHVTDGTARFQTGANQQQFHSFQIRNATANALGLKGTDVTNISAATKALGKIDDAIQAVSSERSKLGSIQNRLASTVNNTTVTHANLSAFESSIRDVDLAKETVEFTRKQILAQAGTAQLAQSKALPQAGLQLLG